MMLRPTRQSIHYVGKWLGVAVFSLLPACKGPRAHKADATAPNPHKPLVLHAKTQELVTKAGLRAPERDKLKKNGFVVNPSPRGYGSTPSTIYAEIYHRDLPVLITSDSILYAFHRSYEQYLAGLEKDYLKPMVTKLLLQTRNNLAKAKAQAKLSPRQASFAEEIDLYLSVPLHLLGAAKRPKLKGSSRLWLRETIRKIKANRSAPLKVMGQNLASFDFSRFKPRGHYTKYRELGPYFQAITWLSQVPIPLEQGQGNELLLDRDAFDRAATLSLLLDQSGQLENYKALVAVLDAFVGPADDEGPQHLLSFLKSKNLQGMALGSIQDAQIQSWLKSNAGQRSRIINQQHFSSISTPNKAVPRNFFLLGQRYLLDSEILQNLVFDRIKDPQNPSQAVLRKLPKNLDIMAALGNPRAKVHLKAEFERYPYEHALDAEAKKVAALPPSFWTQNIHSAWLAAIASLHQSKHTSKLPAVFQTPAWKDKTLQTQLASWAELRHDHLLYGKQSFTGSIMCEFTGAYVEPVPEFFDKMKTLVSLQHAHIDALQKRGFRINKEFHNQLLLFSAVLDTLHGIAIKEVKHIELSINEKHFLKQAVEKEMVGCGSVSWDGWYPRLMGVHPTVGFDPTVADVHVDPPDQANGYKRRILYAATGKFELATIVMDCAEHQQCVYFGPVSSFHEFSASQRLDDEMWMRRIIDEDAIGRPEWTKSFRVERSEDKQTPRR